MKRWIFILFLSNILPLSVCIGMVGSNDTTILSFNHKIPYNSFYYLKLKQLVNNSPTYTWKCTLMIRKDEIKNLQVFEKEITVNVSSGKDILIEAQIALVGLTPDQLTGRTVYMLDPNDLEFNLKNPKYYPVFHTLTNSEVSLHPVQHVEDAGKAKTDSVLNIMSNIKDTTTLIQTQQIEEIVSTIPENDHILLKKNKNDYLLYFADSSFIRLMAVQPGDVWIGSDKKRMDSVIVESNNPDYLNEYPCQKFKINYPFWISEIEISNRYFAMYLSSLNTDTTISEKIRDLPVVQVNWNDANGFCAWLSAQVGGFIFRLPHEIEWEYAAKGSSRNAFPWRKYMISDTLLNYANKYGQVKDVYSFRSGKSPWGMLNMAGNVYEWCVNTEFTYENKSAVFELKPETDDNRNLRAVRGGSFVNNRFECRASARYFLPPDTKNNHIGFRILMMRDDKTRTK